MVNKEEIDRAVLGLEELKKTLPEFSFFGDNNHEAIDAQIEVLKDGSMDDQDIYDKCYDGHTENAAFDAKSFLDGEMSITDLIDS